MDPVFLAVILIVVLVPLLVLVAVSAPKKGGPGISSSKFPPNFSSSLSPKEVLAVVEARLQTMQSIRFKWKTTEKVEKVGRLQSMLTVPYNLSGDNIRISFLMNLLATSRDAGGCTVEWNYVMMSPLSSNPPEIALLEDEIYKKTTLETRAALFIAQGDDEEADFVQTQAHSTRKEIEVPSAREPLKVEELFEDSKAPQVRRVEVTPVEHEELFEDSLTPQFEVPQKPAALSSTLPDLAEAELHSLGTTGTDLGKTPMHVAKNIAGTSLPDIVGEELKSIEGTTGNPSLMQVPEVQSISLGGTPNPLNFSPPDPALSATAAAASGSKCAKCSQARDPSFSFCLYCGHADA